MGACILTTTKNETTYAHDDIPSASFNNKGHHHATT